MLRHGEGGENKGDGKLHDLHDLRQSFDVLHFTAASYVHKINFPVREVNHGRSFTSSFAAVFARFSGWWVQNVA